MKTIFVPVSGTQTDRDVFATALALGRSLPGAHLEFYHLRLDPCESAMRDPHASFCIGPAIGPTLAHFEARDKALAIDSAHHFQDFCESNDIPLLDAPVPGQSISATWAEETNYPEERLLLRARHSDLIVLGRKHTLDLMPEEMIGQLLTASGRPVVVAADTAPRSPIRTIVVGWKESAECARALTAAMPLLAQAKRVILSTVTRDRDRSSALLTHLARQLKWNDIAADVLTLLDDSKSAARQLSEMADAQSADLLVIGAYGHSALREHYFGGVTRALLSTASLPIFFMH